MTSIIFISNFFLSLIFCTWWGCLKISLGSKVDGPPAAQPTPEKVLPRTDVDLTKAAVVNGDEEAKLSLVVDDNVDEGVPPSPTSQV